MDAKEKIIRTSLLPLGTIGAIMFSKYCQNKGKNVYPLFSMIFLNSALYGMFCLNQNKYKTISSLLVGAIIGWNIGLICV